MLKFVIIFESEVIYVCKDRRCSFIFIFYDSQAVNFVVFVSFYDTLNNYPVCCLHKLSMVYTLLFYL